MADGRSLLVTVPGTALALEYERDAAGRLVAIRGDGRTYLAEHDGVRTFDGGWARVSEGTIERGFLRRVATAHGSWIEEYGWDARGLPVCVDGVRIDRDKRGRIVACRGEGSDWRYGYSGDHLTVVEGPHGTRTITRGDDGRPLLVRESGRVARVAYDHARARCDVEPPPARWRRDDLGRLWAVTGADGAVIATFLWDGFACLGRIDGPPGGPLAAIFSLDPARTPTRVITPGGVTRIPRDGFGEGLLGHAGVPGLHGGAVHQGFVYLRSRVLDPRAGSYDRPDPWHGREDDPRRARGYPGPLPVETGATGPYAACQYDGVSFVDPTGESTGLIILSDVSWSFVHNVTGLMGMDLTLNLWLSLFGAPWGTMGEFFELDGFSSDRTGSFGIRRNGVLGGDRMFTYQHQLWGNPSNFDDLSEGLVFAPGARFEPTLYGTLLRGAPSTGAAFLLQGNLDPQAIAGNAPWAWSRSGGTAEAVVPGSNVAYFPSGGLHFDTVYRGVRGPQACTMTELTPVAAAPVVATLSQATLFADSPAPVGGLNAGTLVFLTDGANAADIQTVSVVTAQGAGSRILLASGTSPLGLAGVRLRGLSAPSAPDTMSAGGPANGLSLTGSTLPFTAGDPLRLSQGGAVVGAALITRLEAQLQIDGALPATLTTPITVELASLSGAPVGATLTGNTLSGANLPAPGNFVAVTGGGGTLGALVGGTAAAPTLDRTAAELTPLGNAVTWQRLAPGANLGQAGTRDAGALVTYAPTAPRTAPSAGFVVLRGAAPSPSTARRVASLDHDALVLSALPGATGTAYAVERFTFAAPDIDGLTLGTLSGVSLTSANPLPGVALQLNLLPTPALAAGTVIANTVNLNAGTATVTAAPGVAFNQPTPSQLLVLRDTVTNALEAAVVASVLATVRFDRPIAGLLPDTRLAPLGAGSFAYTAVLNADGTVTALPLVGATAVQMPRFLVGEIVQVVDGGGTSRLFVVSAVAGSTLTLTGPAAPVAGAATPTVQRMVPTPPAAQTGTPWLGIGGAAVPGGPNTDVALRVWRPNDVSAGLAVCVRSTDPAVPATPPVVIPAFVLSVQSVQVTFTASPASVGASCALTVAVPPLPPPSPPNVFYAPTFSQNGTALTVSDLLPAPLPAPGAGPQLVMIVPFAPPTAPVPTLSATGQLGPGSVLCPVDPENWEFDRRQALAEHELTHTEQSATHGQVYWGIWPLFAQEGLMELASDVELPAFSGYADGTIEKVNATSVLRVPTPPTGVTLAQGDLVQVSALNHATSSVTLGPPADGGGFAIPSDSSIPLGQVRIRRQTNNGALGVASEVVYNIFRLTTLGGLMNVVGGAIWGGVIFGIGKLAYLLSRRVFGGGDTYPATVESNGVAIRMSNAEGQAAVQGFSEIIVRGDDSSAKRTVTAMAGDHLQLAEAVEFRGAVRVVPYKTDDISDWHDFFPATVPDATRPARIQVQARGESRLTLSQFDRVTVAAANHSFRTNVTAVADADGHVYDLEEPPAESARAGFRIARVGSNDPIFALDSRMLSEMGVGFLRWFYDPIGQFQYRFQPERNSVWDIVARVGRYGLGTHAWSWLPIPGTLFLQNLFHQPDNGHLSPFEQEASDNSGNLYSPLAKLRGGFERVEDQFATYRATVGDLARYWHTPLHGSGAVGAFSPSVVTQQNLKDTPGPHLQPLITIVPNVTGTASSAREPNGNVAPADTTVAGQFVPDFLVTKSLATPDAAAIVPTPIGTTPIVVQGPAGFNPSAQAMIPLTPPLNQSIGAYVGFTRPGTHRLTVQNGIFDAQSGREAQDDEAQTLWFDVNVTDVTVTAAGTALAQSSPLAQLTLVLLQQVAVTVVPDGVRTYALTSTRPGGALLAPPSPLTLAAGTAAGTDTVEVSRVYAFQPGAAGAPGAFADAVLGQHGGMHVPATFHVAVRTFGVQVVATLPLRTGPEPTDATTVTASPGTPGFLLVPVDIQSGPTATLQYPAGTTPGMQDPNLTPDSETPSDTARAFLGPLGQSFRFAFADPPEEPAELTITVDVRSGATVATLTCGTIAYAPHFRLQDAANAYTIRRDQDLVLSCDGGVTPSGVTVSGASVTVTNVTGGNITLHAAVDAPLGTRSVTCADTAAATHPARRTITVIA